MATNIYAIHAKIVATIQQRNAVVKFARGAQIHHSTFRVVTQGRFVSIARRQRRGVQYIIQIIQTLWAFNTRPEVLTIHHRTKLRGQTMLYVVHIKLKLPVMGETPIRVF